MYITHIKLKNWRNFKEVDLPLRDTTYILGANASGKSNLLDVFRFLRDVSKPHGGGLQKAVDDRGGVKKLKCLHARGGEVRIEVHLSNDVDDPIPDWKYSLAFREEQRGLRRILVSEENVWHKDSKKPLLRRPTADDNSDSDRLTQTHLEQIQANSTFREIPNFFSEATYLHLVPQLLKFGDRIGGHRLEDDPFGQGFLESVAKSQEKTRKARLKKIGNALKLAVPQFEQLEYIQDETNGRPHLQARYAHFRPRAGLQREDQFSDGTLRLIGLLWSLLENNSLLLLEEPELSLNDSITEQIPLMMSRVQRESKRRRQIIISTHSDALLKNKGIDGRGVILLEPSLDQEGTTARVLNDMESNEIKSGLSIAEVALPKTRPDTAEQLAFW